jgi:hypothetical protein
MKNKVLVLVASLIVSPTGLNAASSWGDAQRDQVLLNGDWPEGGAVPEYFGGKFERKTYRRTVHVPESWNGKHIELVFRQVNYSVKVFVNGQLEGSHVGGWVPFAVDLSDRAKPGSDFDLRVEVKSSTVPPYADEEKRPLWPVGTYNFDGTFAGIIDDVWLRAYGEVGIHDAFIRTSVRDHAIEVDYTLVNHSGNPRQVRIRGEAVSIDDGKVECALNSDPIVIEAGATRMVTVRKSWKDPRLWWPDQPRLYQLRSRVIDKAAVVDREARRFGFREITISTNQYFLNGIRANLWGDSIPRSWTDQKRITPEAWPATLDMLKNDLNQRIIRWHQFPPSDYLLDVADEKGLMIIEESALYARPWTQTNQQKVIDNMRQTWIPEWIHAHRGHPSIVLWSAENEDYKCVGGFSPEQLQSLSETIRLHDGTRPVIHDGDEDLNGLARTFNWHYPEGYERLTSGSIYSWAGKVQPSKPTGIGEFLACPWVEKMKPQVFWWHGTWCRGLRYLNFTDIRPFVMTWAWDGKQPEAKANLRRSFSPVALFDKAYDDLGIEPLMTERYPSLQSGSRAERVLVLYNDEFRGTKLTVEVELASGGQTHARGKRTYDLPLGEHRDIPVAFDVPATTGPAELILSVRKDGKVRFTETKEFHVPHGEGTAKLSRAVVLGGLR